MNESRSSLPSVGRDERQWIACSGCSGEVGLPPGWDQETVRCPNCGTTVPVVAPQSAVQWRPRGGPIEESTQLDTGPALQSSVLGCVTAAPAPPCQASSAKADLPVNGYAITGLSLGIASVFLAWIGIIPLLAIIFSGIGLAKVKQRQGKGQVQAWIGLILGILFMFASLYEHGHFH